MSNNRTRNRFPLSMKVEIVGEDSNKRLFYEECQSKDASSFGVSLIMKTFVSRRTIVYLGMPLPSHLRLHDIGTSTYTTYGIVRHVEPRVGGFYQVGVSILGKISPKGYESYEKIFTEIVSKRKQQSAKSVN